jgi:hypothetical protein
LQEEAEKKRSAERVEAEQRKWADGKTKRLAAEAEKKSKRKTYIIVAIAALVLVVALVEGGGSSSDFAPPATTTMPGTTPRPSSTTATRGTSATCWAAMQEVDRVLETTNDDVFDRAFRKTLLVCGDEDAWTDAASRIRIQGMLEAGCMLHEHTPVCRNR